MEKYLLCIPHNTYCQNYHTAFAKKGLTLDLQPFETLCDPNLMKLCIASLVLLPSRTAS